MTLKGLGAVLLVFVGHRLASTKAKQKALTKKTQEQEAQLSLMQAMQDAQAQAPQDEASLVQTLDTDQF